MDRVLPVSLLIMSLCLLSFGQDPVVGERAPSFSLRYATRDSIARDPLPLSEALKQSPLLVLAFYPADWSSGCTKELCSMRDDVASLGDLGATVLAVSGDYVYSHHEWAKTHDLPFRLLSDHDHAVARAYASYNESSGYNKRTVYVIDGKGTIRYRDLEYSVRDGSDYAALKSAIAGLKQ